MLYNILTLVHGTCTEPDTHALIKKLINLVSQFNEHLIINCFRFNYFCPNIVKIYILSGFLQIYITFYGFFSKRIAVNALFKVVLYIVERFDSLDYGRLYYSQHYTPRDYGTESSLILFVIVVLHLLFLLDLPIRYWLCMYRAGFLFLLTVKD